MRADFSPTHHSTTVCSRPSISAPLPYSPSTYLSVPEPSLSPSIFSHKRDSFVTSETHVTHNTYSPLVGNSPTSAGGQDPYRLSTARLSTSVKPIVASTSRPIRYESLMLIVVVVVGYFLCTLLFPLAIWGSVVPIYSPLFYQATYWCANQSSSCGGLWTLIFDFLQVRLPDPRTGDGIPRPALLLLSRCISMSGTQAQPK